MAANTDRLDGPVELGVIFKRLMFNTGLLLSGRAGNAVLGLGYMALAGRGLGASGLGVLVLIHAFAQLISDVMKFQSWQAVLQYGARPLVEGRQGAFQAATRFALALDGLSAAVGLAVGVGGAILFADKLGWGREHATTAGVYMLCILGMVCTTPVGLMRLFNRFDVLAQQTVLVSLTRLIGCGAAFLLHGGLAGFLFAWAAGQFVGLAYLSYRAVGELRKRGLLRGFRWTGAPLTEGMPGAWRFAWNTNISSTLDAGLTHVATLTVGALLGPAPAAFWKVGRQIADAIAKPARLLAPALYPELARLRAADSETMMLRLAARVGMLAGGAGLVLLTAAAFAGPWILTVVMGKEFAPAASVMTWQVAAATVGVLVLPLEPMLISLGRAGAVVCVQLAVCAAFFGAMQLLIPPFGLTGAGIGLLGAELALGAGLLLVLRPGGHALRLSLPVRRQLA